MQFQEKASAKLELGQAIPHPSDFTLKAQFVTLNTTDRPVYILSGKKRGESEIYFKYQHDWII